MSPLVSSTLVLLLFVVVAAPAALGAVGGWVGKATAAFYIVLALGVLAHNSSFPARATSDVRRLVGSPEAAAENGPCQQALSAAQRGRVILDRSAPGRLVVDGELWQMLPETVRGALTDCANQLGGNDGEGIPVEIVERGG